MKNICPINIVKQEKNSIESDRQTLFEEIQDFDWLVESRSRKKEWPRKITPDVRGALNPNPYDEVLYHSNFRLQFFRRWLLYHSGVFEVWCPKGRLRCVPILYRMCIWRAGLCKRRGEFTVHGLRNLDSASENDCNHSFKFAVCKGQIAWLIRKFWKGVDF
jgi:hypothetical protein